MFQVLKSPLIADRRDFGALCNFCRYYECAEIGVDRGDFASHFMRQWRGNEHNGRYTLSLVDPYEPYGEMPWPRNGDMAHAMALLAPYGDHVRFVRMRSVEAADWWRSYRGRLDFAYIDADHSYESVTEDLLAWWPLIHEDGMIAGHDYSPASPGVIEAVSRFADTHDLTVYVTQDTVTEPSWYIWKNPAKQEAACQKVDSPQPSTTNGQSS